MHSNKRNSILALATGLTSSLFKVTLSGSASFHQLQQFQRLYHNSTNVLCSFLQYCVDDDLRFACYGFIESAVLAKAFPILFFVWNVTQVFKIAGNKV